VTATITDDQIKAMNPEMAATWIKGMGPMSEAQYRVLVIACRNGGFVSAAESKEISERVPASALLALVRRGYLIRGSEGHVTGRLSQLARGKLADTVKVKDVEVCRHCGQELYETSDGQFECGGEGEGLCSFRCLIGDYRRLVGRSEPLEGWLDAWIIGEVGVSWAEIGWDRDAHLKALRDDSAAREGS
jgi:hypothetical protein